MNYSESLNYLYGLGHEVLAAKYGLESVTRLLEELNRPDRAFPSVVVAGTNGKGSVSAMLEAIALAAGLRVALFTSPHLVRLEERFRVGGREISAEDLARHATRVRAAAESLVASGRLDAPPTFFEQVTAIALSYFQEAGAELAILEVGLGGRLDATNAVERLLSVVTTIDYDHQDILGSDIAHITAEKAAIIVPGARAVIGRQQYDEATAVLMDRCIEVGVPPAFANQPQAVAFQDFGRAIFDYESSRAHYSRMLLSLRGRHQTANAAAAIEAAEQLADAGLPITRESIIRGLRQARWPGRLELIEDRPAILLDGAHNPAGARALRDFLDEFRQGPVTLVFGAMADKDLEGMARALFEAAEIIVLTRVRYRRAASGAELGEYALASSRKVIFTETVGQALSWARGLTPPGGLICVAGSLYLIGETKRALEAADEVGNR